MCETNVRCQAITRSIVARVQEDAAAVATTRDTAINHRRNNNITDKSKAFFGLFNFWIKNLKYFWFQNDQKWFRLIHKFHKRLWLAWTRKTTGEMSAWCDQSAHTATSDTTCGGAGAHSRGRHCGTSHCETATTTAHWENHWASTHSTAQNHWQGDLRTRTTTDCQNKVNLRPSPRISNCLSLIFL